jgi:hypothetical protein
MLILVAGLAAGATEAVAIVTPMEGIFFKANVIRQS